MTTEKELQQQIVELAEICGWRVNHVFPLQTRRGEWRTSTTWKGWPDLTLVRPPQLVFIEVKGPDGRPTAEQTDTLHILEQLPGVVAMVARPDDWDYVQQLLTTRTAA